MSIPYTQLEHAFYASDMEPDAMAWIHVRTGEVRISSPSIEGDEPPPDGDTDWRIVPGARDLDLKHRLVDAFVDTACPPLGESVRRCFSRRGAWRAYKDLLARHRLLDRWYAFEAQAQRRALLAWAQDEGIDIIDPPAAENP
jgi:hypothetical protein